MKSLYFSHDANAHDDPKCMLLIDQLGMEGYGIFWILIEVLRIEPEMKYQLALLPILARRYNTSAEKMLAVVSKYDLFKVENNEFFFSESLRDRVYQISDMKRNAVQVRWENEKRKNYDKQNNVLQDDTRVLQMNNTCNTDVIHNKVNKSKLKKSKEDIYIAPISDEISQTRTPLQIFIKEKCPNISKMKNQLTAEESQRLIDDYSKDDIKTILAEMENYKLLSTKNISVNLTIRKWIKMKEEREANVRRK